jgi:hypothetical protein
MGAKPVHALAPDPAIIGKLFCTVSLPLRCVFARTAEDSVSRSMLSCRAAHHPL